jgi:hypothetical protein
MLGLQRLSQVYAKFMLGLCLGPLAIRLVISLAI